MKKSKDRIIKNLRKQVKLHAKRAETMYGRGYHDGRRAAMDGLRTALGLKKWSGGPQDNAEDA